MKTLAPGVVQPPSVALPAPRRERFRDRRTGNDMWWGYLMIAPLSVGLLIFYIWPALQTFYYSFTKWGAFGTNHWTGISNYQKLLSDPDVGLALRNTLAYTAVTVSLSIAIAIVLAVLLNQKIRGVGIYRTLYFLPVVTMPAAVAMVWRWLYNGDYGIINYALSGLSIHGPRWISDPHIALFSVIVVGIWMTIGYNLVIFLAGLQGIPRELYEAAAIDGAGALAKFRRITVPLLTPAIFFVAVIQLISGLQVFDVIYLMIATPPGNPATESVQSMVYLFFEKGFGAFGSGDKGYASAIAFVLVGIILLVTLIQFRLQKRWVHYA